MLKYGDNNIGKVYLGSNSIGKAYYGSNLVFQKGSGPTPPPYTPVDYIETDGVAYINTGIKGNVQRSVELYMTPVIPASGNDYVMGCRKDSGDTRFIPLLIHSAGYAGCAYGSSIYNGTQNSVNCSTSATNKTPMYVRCSFNVGALYFGVKQAGESSYTTRTHTNSASISTDMNMFVLACNFYDAVSPAEAGTRLYHLKIWGAGDYTTNLLFDGIACIYNGEYGLWDKVSNSFFGNAAESGAFFGPSNS